MNINPLDDLGEFEETALTEQEAIESAADNELDEDVDNGQDAES
jgi:hypothetical protein